MSGGEVGTGGMMVIVVVTEQYVLSCSSELSFERYVLVEQVL